MKHSFLLLVALLAIAGVAQAKNPVVEIKTSMGVIEVELYQNDAPKAVENFIGHAKNNYYNGILFHRVIKGFVIQAGDPNTKDKSKKAQWGMGGQSIWNKPFEDELNPATQSYKDGYQPGVLAMANSGPNTNGSQFFIMCGSSLPHKYTIFGKVTKGMDVVRKIEATPTDPQDHPKTDVVIEKMTVK